MLKPIIFSFLLLGFLTGQTNVAMAQIQNLAAGNSYTLVPAPTPPYDDDGTKLTDEQLTPLIPTDQGWVGFGFGDPQISFNLKNLSRISEVRAHFLDYPAWGIHVPQGVELQTSTDNSTWITQGDLVQQNPDGLFSLSLPDISAQYVRLVISRNFWTFISEVEIFGESIVEAPSSLRKVLYLTSTPNPNNESFNRMINTLDSLAFPYDVIGDDQIADTNLSDYQLVIVDGTSFEFLDINRTEEERIVASIQAGVNYLWIGGGIWGSFETSNLPNAFGLQYQSENTSTNLGITEAEFTDLGGTLTKFPVFNEYIRIVQPTEALVEGSYYGSRRKSPIPFITKHLTESGAQTVYISLPILDFWKSTEATYTYARTELLTKYIQQLTAQGYVGLHPVKNGKEAAFLLRLEDYTPGGTYIDHSVSSWLNRMQDFLTFTKENLIPMNIALVPIYSHPFLGEQFTWSDTTQQIPLLKSYAEQAASAGGSLIVHGLKHQNGTAEDDYSGDDWEMWNEDTLEYLSSSEQQEITNLARAEAALQFHYTPAIWETPHYTSNADTYLAAANSGFTYFTESDTKLFPNQRGYLNKSNGTLWNIPETAFDFPENRRSIRDLEPIKKDHILPRLVRLHAPYYIFYHNNLDAQLNSLQRIVEKAKTYNLWYPNIEEYGDFWLAKEQASVNTTHDRELQKMTATVSNSFEGLTLSVRLPNGMKADQILVNGASVPVSQKFVDGIWFANPVMPAGATTTVQVSYIPGM